jgi:fatty-acyl-CoA synthase
MSAGSRAVRPFPPFPTLVAALEDAAKADPTLGFRFVPETGVPGFGGGDASEASFSYTAIERASARYGGALQALGLAKGDRVALILPTNEDFVLCFFGALRAGIVPVPIYPPLGIGQLQGYLDNTRHIVAKAGARALVTTAQIKRLLGTVQAGAERLEQVVAVEAIRESLETLKPVRVAPDDVAFLQFTSGSTSRPKGVTLTHANLLANVKCIMHDGLRLDEGDVGISWLPLYHDMGLIGFVLAPVIHRVPIVFLPPLLFLKRPIAWLQAFTRHRGTIGFGPNFAYALCTKRIRDRDPIVTSRGSTFRRGASRAAAPSRFGPRPSSRSRSSSRRSGSTSGPSFPRTGWPSLPSRSLSRSSAKG